MNNPYTDELDRRLAALASCYRTAEPPADAIDRLLARLTGYRGVLNDDVLDAVAAAGVIEHIQQEDPKGHS
jgi:hypothetical protein